ncbi:hypothetical protein F5Y19DRAFT_245524 [Xylariaceae sp. FL1651]|nr:hypothetical protein F5Y19DRAFT_245524 [Xylariaceae sp. FL1651]
MAGEADIESKHQRMWNITKIFLRCFSFILGVLMVGLSVNDGLRLQSWYESNRGSYHPRYPYWYFHLPIALVSAIVDCSEWLFTFIRKRTPGIPPGWHIGLELALLSASLVTLVFTKNLINNMAFPYADGPIPRHLQSLRIALLFITGLFSIVRFLLFTIACVDTHMYRRSMHKERVVRTLRELKIIEDVAADRADHLLYFQALNCTNYTYYDRSACPQELPALRSPQELSNEFVHHRELPGSQMFPVELSPERFD